jgi:hypothetical protein
MEETCYLSKYSPNKEKTGNWNVNLGLHTVFSTERIKHLSATIVAAKEIIFSVKAFNIVKRREVGIKFQEEF